MSLPGGVSTLIDEDDLLDRVSLDDHRSLFVTADRAIAHRERSLLTEASVDVYPTDVERLVLEEGKRQATVSFEYADDETRELLLPTGTMAAALKTLLASVIRATGVIEGDESILELFRFNELTLVVTDRRLLKHVGWALWADSYDATEFEDIRDIQTEEGQVSTGINIETTSGSDRVKIPHDDANRFVSRLNEAVCDYHGVSSLAALRGDDTTEPDPEPDLDRLRPLSVGDDEPDDEPFRMEHFDAVDVDDELLDRLDELATAIDEQLAVLESYRETIDHLERELTRDR